MPDINVMGTKTGYYAVLLLAVVLLAACSEQPPPQQEAKVWQLANQTAAYYLQQAQQSADDSKADWQLLAIRALLNEKKLPQARAELARLPARLNPARQRERQLLRAQAALAGQQDEEAQRNLKSLDPSALSAEQQYRYWQLTVAAQQHHPSLTLLRAYVAQEPLLQGAEQQQNIDATWQTLQQMSPEQITRLVINADENTLRGWLDLLHQFQNRRADQQMLNSAIRDWQVRYPQHPAAKMLPSQLVQAKDQRPVSLSNIALLLPAEGQAKVFASAIEKGFNDARNGVGSRSATAMDSGSPSVTDAAQPGVAETEDAQPAAAEPDDADQQAGPANATQVAVYDTSSQPLQTLFDQAQQQGATLIVGPLLKNNVEQLAKIKTSLNVLALNQPEQRQYQPNICYFALSPEDEARGAAAHMWHQAKQMPLLLVPRGALGDRVSAAFADEWGKQGGGTVLKQPFGPVAELKQGINSGAGITLHGTPVTGGASSGKGNTDPEPDAFSDSRSWSASPENVDAIYIVSTQDELQLIKPMIAMRVSSHDNIAIYASSRSFRASVGADFRLEMEGLQFSDIPLLTGGNPSLMQQAMKTFNNDYSLVRLYAMGMDAWALANHYNALRQPSGFQLQGNTGSLTADADCVINRKLSWSQYRHGQIVPVN